MSRSVLEPLQSFIESLHGVVTDLDVAAYVVDAERWRSLPGAREGLPEQIFVRTDPGDDSVELALYIAADVVDELQRDHPHVRLHRGNLESYCIALEGISHFVLLAWRAQHGWPVRALELEIQAEVDKFVASWLLLMKQGGAPLATAQVLRRRLFCHYSLRDELSPEEASRYHTATGVADRYCAYLLRKYGRDAQVEAIKRDVRRYYRGDLNEKMRAA